MQSFYFFFFKQKTAYEMRISDWSSDVCSSDLSVNMPLIKGFSVVGVRAGEYGRRFPERGAENVAAIDALAAAGRIRPHVHAALELADWREGFAMLERREAVGKVVLRP